MIRISFSAAIALILVGCGGGGNTSSMSNATGDAMPLIDTGEPTPPGDAASGVPGIDGAQLSDTGTLPPASDAGGGSDGSDRQQDAAAVLDGPVADTGPAPVGGDGGVGWDQVPSILARIVPPTFPSLDCNVTNYGGVGDGVTDNTTPFANAIADCVNKGGGRVVAPLAGTGPTTYFTGPIELKSNINLDVPAGVTIRFSTDPNKYLPNVEVSFEGSLLYNYHPLVWAHDATNVAITGAGTLDGNATPADWYAWLPATDSVAAADALALRTQNAMAVPIVQRQYGTGHHLRPSLIEFMNVTNILFDGFTAQNSPFWTIHPVMSKNITARNLHSLGSQPNTDGFDPESCVDVLLDHLTIQVGDDPIAIKAGRDLDGRTFYTPTENVVIENGSFNSGNPTHGGAISIGSEMSAGVRNVYAQDNTFTSTGGVLAQAIYLKASIYRGGFIENFYARRFTVDQIATFFFLNGQYSAGAVPANSPVIFTTFNNINVDTATVNAATSEGFRITGADATQPATGIHLSNITITQAGTVLRAGASHYTGLTTSNVSVNGTPFAPAASVP